ncbi:MAG TPA: hypothetical protein VEC12_12570 [Bacteroidia bacterium]|nr:hypothetical protein [Bacteroidia bacterium]
MENKNYSEPANSGGALPMILSHAAYYADPQSILNQYPLSKNWNVVWAGNFSNANYAFIATDGSAYAVAIRGSELDFSEAALVNWFEEDLNVYLHNTWDWYVPTSAGNNYKAIISRGAYDGLTELQTMTDATTGGTLADFLVTNAANNNAWITVTGHSLGGNLATVFGPWLQWYINNNSSSNYNGKNTVYSNMGVYTYAAPTAGNPDFAEYYDDLFPGTNSARFYNTNDIIPQFAANISTVENMFTNGPQAAQISYTYDGITVTLSNFFFGVRMSLYADMWKYGFYTQTNQTAGTFSFTLPIDQTYLANTLEDWLEQAASQHSGVAYLNHFLDAQKVFAKRSKPVQVSL